jgi:integrase
MIYARKDSRFWWVGYYVKSPAGKLVQHGMSTKIVRLDQDGKEDKDAKTKAKQFEQDVLGAVEDLKTKKRLEKMLMSMLAAITGAAADRPGLALSAVWDRYSNHPSQKNRTARTQSSKRIAWNRFVEWLKLEFPQVEAIDDVSRDFADRYLKTLDGKRAATFNNNKNSLSAIWQVLAVEAGLKENIWRLFKGAENDSTRYRDFSIEEIRAILAKSSELWRGLTATAYFTGLRLKDCVHLRKSQIQGDFIVLTPAKTRRKKKDVTIFIHQDLKKILDFHYSRTPESEDFIFPEAASQYDTFDFQREFGQILIKAEIKEDGRGIVGFHSLRHSFVTSMEKQGASRQTLQGIVGHGSPLMTAHYSHDTEASRIIGRMPSLLECKNKDCAK